ncbi:MAG: NYN domain-containing protein [Clostridia bacterium]|nr:NYN domain-containing protein [Clostridia bacterium]
MAITDRRFAVLIDADNISDRYIKIVLDEISNDGEATYKRIYGDWTKPALAPWKRVLLEHSVTPIQQYGYTTGKNATDSAMIIDAMDILYSGNVDGFCLVTSDSDFTRLASRLRESGMLVVGMGEQKTPKAFISACNKFKYLDILSGSTNIGTEKNKVSSKPKMAAKPIKPTITKVVDKTTKPTQRIDDEEDMLRAEITSLETIKAAISTIISETSDEDEWVSISDLGNRLLKRYPDFDVRNYGFPKLTPFLKSLKGFEMKSVRNENSSVRQVYLRELQPNRE